VFVNQKMAKLFYYNADTELSNEKLL